MGGKMKIRLGKPAVNDLKVMGGKNKKRRRGFYVKNFVHIYILLLGKHWMEGKMIEYVIYRQEDF